MAKWNKIPLRNTNKQNTWQRHPTVTYRVLLLKHTHSDAHTVNEESSNLATKSKMMTTLWQTIQRKLGLNDLYESFFFQKHQISSSKHFLGQIKWPDVHVRECLNCLSSMEQIILSTTSSVLNQWLPVLILTTVSH